MLFKLAGQPLKLTIPMGDLNLIYNTRFPGPTPVPDLPSQSGISIKSTVFARYTTVTIKQTERQTDTLTDQQTDPRRLIYTVSQKKRQ